MQRFQLAQVVETAALRVLNNDFILDLIIDYCYPGRCNSCVMDTISPRCKAHRRDLFHFTTVNKLWAFVTARHLWNSYVCTTDLISSVIGNVDSSTQTYKADPTLWIENQLASLGPHSTQTFR